MKMGEVIEVRGMGIRWEKRIFIKEGGSHRTRINNMPQDQKEEVYQTLQQFLSQ